MLNEYEPTVEITADGLPQVRMWRGKPIVRFNIKCMPAGNGDGGGIMSESVLEEYVRQNILDQNYKKVCFNWYGQDPALCGKGFFARAVELQKKYKTEDVSIDNDFLTDGSCIDEDWCSFFKENSFQVGLKLEVSTAQTGLKTAGLLKQYNIPFYVRTEIDNDTVTEALEVYRLLKDEAGAALIKFSPKVELVSSNSEKPVISPSSVKPDQWGDFLCKIFDEWYSKDTGNISVCQFESALYTASGVKSPVCLLNPMCGKGMALLQDGSVYSCDRFIKPGYELGNIMQKSIHSMLFSHEQHKFGYSKMKELTQECRDCRFLDWCYGECPINRFTNSCSGEKGHNYLCTGYKKFFEYASERLRILAREKMS